MYIYCGTAGIMRKGAYKPPQNEYIIREYLQALNKDIAEQLLCRKEWIGLWAR